MHGYIIGREGKIGRRAGYAHMGLRATSLRRTSTSRIKTYASVHTGVGGGGVGGVRETLGERDLGWGGGLGG